jgi:protein-S-isoprenylcysteine O-methyltransferase Ste14
MGMREEFEASGTWLFRRRGYLPPLLFPMLLVASARTDGTTLGARWEALCLALALGGLALRAATVGFVPKDTSQRNTGRPQAEALNTTGMYSVVRHPLYLGNYLMWLGVALFSGAWWAPVIASLVFWLYYERIMFAEEEFLRRRFGEDYTAWAGTTPAFLPRLRGWRPPETGFSLLTVLRREPSTLLALIAALAVLKLVSAHAATGRPTLGPVWGTALAITLALCLAARTLKHRTRLLHVEGR